MSNAGGSSDCPAAKTALDRCRLIFRPPVADLLDCTAGKKRSWEYDDVAQCLCRPPLRSGFSYSSPTDYCEPAWHGCSQWSLVSTSCPNRTRSTTATGPEGIGRRPGGSRFRLGQKKPVRLGARVAMEGALVRPPDKPSGRRGPQTSVLENAQSELLRRSSAIRTNWPRVRTPVFPNSCRMVFLTALSDRSIRAAISLLPKP